MKNISVLLAVSISFIFLSGCAFSFSGPCPPESVLENVFTVRFHVTDKETGLPIKAAATSMEFVKFSFKPDEVGNCFPKRIHEGKFLVETNDDGFCETSFTTFFRTEDDSYTIHYSVGKQHFERVDGTSDFYRGDSERTIEIKLLNNTNQP